jgi:hypothetical protein
MPGPHFNLEHVTAVMKVARDVLKVCQVKVRTVFALFGFTEGVPADVRRVDALSGR